MISHHWVSQEVKQVLSTLRTERRYVAALKTDLADFRELFWFGADHQRTWAGHMIKSIEHELVEIEAGRLSVPVDSEEA